MTKQVLVPVADAASDDASDALWQLSVKKDAQRKSQELNALRWQYHTEQADRHQRTLSRLVQFHLHEAEKLEKKGSAA
jgi:macrodomain Ter protein organizer (MatP/YcbG family)